MYYVKPSFIYSLIIIRRQRAQAKTGAHARSAEGRGGASDAAPLGPSSDHACARSQEPRAAWGKNARCGVFLYGL